MRGDAVAALIRHAHRHVEHLLGQRIQRPGRHDLLDRFPGALERRRIVRQRLPEIVDPVGFPRGHDVVKNRAHFRTGVSIFDQAGCRHAGILPIADTPERLTENGLAGGEAPWARPQAVSAARIVRWGRVPRVGAGGEYRAKASVLRSLYLSPPLVQNRFPLPRRSSSRCGRPRPTTSGTDLAPCRIDAAGHNPRNAPPQRPISVSSYRPAAWMGRRCSSSLLSSRYPESD